MASLAEKRNADAEEDSVDPQARPEELRLLEALLFASSEPLDQAALAKRMPDGVDVKVALAQLQADYASRGVNLVRVANKWTFRTAGELAWLTTGLCAMTRTSWKSAIWNLRWRRQWSRNPRTEADLFLGKQRQRFALQIANDAESFEADPILLHVVVMRR